MSTAETVPSQSRVLPFRKRNDLRIQSQPQSSKPYVAKDPVRLRYWHLSKLQYLVLTGLDGTCSLLGLQRQIKTTCPELFVTQNEIQATILDLHTKGLVLSTRPGQSQILARRRRREIVASLVQALMNPLFVRLGSIDCDALLSRAAIYSSALFSPLGALLSIIACSTTAIMIVCNPYAVHEQLPAYREFWVWPNILFLWAAIGTTKTVHELGHGLALKTFNCECRSVGFALLVFTPTMFCDASDAWMTPNKWKRIWISAAGMQFEVLLATMAFWLWWFANPGLVKHVLLSCFFVSTASTVIFNANPLMKLDGYYILSDMLGTSNLKEKSTLALQQLVATAVGFRLVSQENTNELPHWFYVSYGIMSLLYRWFITVSIMVAMYVGLKSMELSSIGIMLAPVVVIAPLVHGMYLFGKGVTSLDNGEPMNYRKSVFTGAVLVAVAFFVFGVHVPVHRQAPLYAESHNVQHVYANQSGLVFEQAVRDGQVVSKGDILLVLQDRVVEMAVKDRTHIAKISQVEVDVASRIFDHREYAIKEQELKGNYNLILNQIARYEQLTIRAPCDGTVIAPIPRKKSAIETQQRRLSMWSDSPLDAWNEGSVIESGTLVCSVKPNHDRFIAKIIVDQVDRDDIWIGMPLKVKFNHCPVSTLNASVSAIAKEQSEIVPAFMSQKYGGRLATITDSSGQERLTSNAYRVEAILDGKPKIRFAESIRGTAQFVVANRTIGQWIHRWISQNFRFVL